MAKCPSTRTSRSPDSRNPNAMDGKIWCGAPASGHLIDVKAGVLRTVIRAWSVTNTAI